MTNLLLFCCLTLLTMSCNGESSTESGAESDDVATTTIILVRHAEKDAGDDPDLLPAGQERAQQLRDLLAKENIVAVYTTDTRRTRATAQPTAGGHSVEAQLYDPSDQAALVAPLRSRYRSKAVLVVGHSNSIPELVGLLTDGGATPTIGEDDFGNIFYVTLPRTGKGKLSARHY